MALTQKQERSLFFKNEFIPIFFVLIKKLCAGEKNAVNRQHLFAKVVKTASSKVFRGAYQKKKKKILDVSLGNGTHLCSSISVFRIVANETGK